MWPVEPQVEHSKVPSLGFFARVRTKRPLRAPPRGAPHARGATIATRAVARGSSSSIIIANTSSRAAALDLVLERPGQHPRWDAYLRSVYGSSAIEYPFALSRLTWLYWTAPLDKPIQVHCQCGGPDKACPEKQVPHGDGFIHKTGHTYANHDFKRTHIEFNFTGDSLSALGFWVARPFQARACGAHSTSCEVIRVDKPNEREAGAAWYNGAIGSGMWLRVGRLGDFSCVTGWAIEEREHAGLRLREPPPPHCRSSLPNRTMEYLHNGSKVWPNDQRLATSLRDADLDTLLRLYDVDDARMLVGDASRMEFATAVRGGADSNLSLIHI